MLVMERSDLSQVLEFIEVRCCLTPPVEHQLLLSPYLRFDCLEMTRGRNKNGWRPAPWKVL